MGWVVQDLGLGDFDVIRASLIFANGNAFSRLNCSHNKFCLYSMISALKFAKKLKFVEVCFSLNLQLIFPLCMQCTISVFYGIKRLGLKIHHSENKIFS